MIYEAKFYFRFEKQKCCTKRMAFELLYYKPIPTQKCYYASRKVAWKPFLFHAQGGMMGQKENVIS